MEHDEDPPQGGNLPPDGKVLAGQGQNPVDPNVRRLLWPFSKPPVPCIPRQNAAYDGTHPNLRVAGAREDGKGRRSNGLWQGPEPQTALSPRTQASDGKIKHADDEKWESKPKSGTEEQI